VAHADQELAVPDLSTRSFYLRELIPTDHAFYAFDGRRLITIEVRTFVRDDKVDCMHPYWPIDSIGSGPPA